MRKIQVFEASSPQGQFLEKAKKPYFRYGLRVCVPFFVWSGGPIQIDKQIGPKTYTLENSDILDRLPASLEF